jgi:dihydroneopterin aldolase
MTTRRDRIEVRGLEGALIDQLNQVLPAERFQLLERLVDRMAELVLEYPLVAEVTVTVAKRRSPVAAHVDTTGVSIHRRKP